MCLIIHQKKGKTLDYWSLVDIYERNPDGFGFMFANGGQLFTYRSIASLDQAIELYYEKCAGRECLIHWRMKTHGDVNVNNAHPFVLGTSKVAMMHNGIIDVGTPIKGMSDTYHVAEFLLKPIAMSNRDHLFSEDFSDVLGDMIGMSNRIAMMDNDGRVNIINKHTGVHFEGNWYSNTYAWDCPKSLLRATYYNANNVHRLGWADREDEYGPAMGNPAPLKALPSGTTNLLTSGQITAVSKLALLNAVMKSHEEGARQWLRDNPISAANLMREHYQTDMTKVSEECASMLLAELASSTDFVH